MFPQNNLDPLAELNDILTGSEPSFFPVPYIYWYILAGIILFLAVCYFLYKGYKKQRDILKPAFIELNKIETFIELNKLLKWVAMQYVDRVLIASLYGASWFDYLQLNAESNIFGDKTLFIQRVYQSKPSRVTDEDLMQAKIWIKQFKKHNAKHNTDDRSYPKREKDISTNNRRVITNV